MEIFPVKYPEKTERKTGLTGSGNEKLADLEKEAALAIGKNFIKASGEAVDEALEMTKTLDPVLIDVCNTISI